MKVIVLLLAAVLMVLLIDYTDGEKHQHEEGKHKHWNHKHHGKKEHHHHHKFRDNDVKSKKSKRFEKEYKSQEKNIGESPIEQKKIDEQFNEPNLEPVKQQDLVMDTKHKNLRHGAGHQEKVQYEKKYWKNVKENETPKDNSKVNDGKVTLAQKTTDATAETIKLVKELKPHKGKEDKFMLYENRIEPKTVSQEEQTGDSARAAKVATLVDPGVGNMVSLTETKNNEITHEIKNDLCTSNADCKPGFCCQSKNGKTSKCQKVQLGLGRRCRETCMCGESLVCHFQKSSNEKKRKNDNNPIGVCKRPEIISYR
ncbi:uncharacterized protein LOC111086497 [Limulus polyphemus]|uniref:Uncharacterized protein LOC111086497 n=1 Tax=Limulus polyphemus TaxID=6850 RepID=A0ABM1SNR8_LIMPO|nr:uncharacterized protein LOC111086497 [Limulus polyphemus]XP_022245275.1 uncharacterized protein LOC111086497 [Limulus polyphemus]XP_022245276.1 uncharacterized protein LOC111086497 [Limulus polyphemus]